MIDRHHHHQETRNHAGLRMICLVVAVFGGMLAGMAIIAGRSPPIGVALIGAGILGGSVIHMTEIIGSRSGERRAVAVEALIATAGLVILIGASLNC